MRTLFVHLRLHFQLLLAPVFLWGWLLAGGGLSRAVLLGFVAFHFFLYAGATAFNSYYDRDVGPVGGLERPPQVQPALLPFSLVVQGLGWALAGALGVPFVDAPAARDESLDVRPGAIMIQPGLGDRMATMRAIDVSARDLQR